MADAWPNSQTRYLFAAVPGVSTRRRRAVHAIRGAKGSRLRRSDYHWPARGRRRGRTNRSQRPARSDNYPDRAAPRLFLSVAILAVRIVAAVDRNFPDAHRSGRRHRAAVRPAFPFRNRREELASTTILRRDRDSHRDDRRNSHLARNVLPVVAG